jgi:hypothetical protein
MTCHGGIAAALDVALSRIDASFDVWKAILLRISDSAKTAKQFIKK